MKKLLVISILLALLVSLYIHFVEQSVPVSTSTNALREPIDFTYLPGNIYEAVCKAGHPVLVSDWELDNKTRFVFFEGPFKQSSAPGSKVYQYLYKTIESIESDKVSTTLLVHSLDEYQSRAFPEELKQFQLPIIHNIPGELSGLVEILGQWDVELAKKRPQRRRLIYDRRLCIGTKLVSGVYFDVVDGKVVKAKGIKTQEKLSRIIRNIQIFPPDKEFLHYVDHIPETNSAKDVVVQLVLLREAGKQDEALKLLSDQLQNDWIKNNITSQAEKGIPINLDSLKYKATKYTHDSANISIEYYLQNGSLLSFSHKLIKENGRWLVRH